MKLSFLKFQHLVYKLTIFDVEARFIVPENYGLINLSTTISKGLKTVGFHFTFYDMYIMNLYSGSGPRPLST